MRGKAHRHTTTRAVSNRSSRWSRNTPSSTCAPGGGSPAGCAAPSPCSGANARASLAAKSQCAHLGGLARAPRRAGPVIARAAEQHAAVRAAGAALRRLHVDPEEP